MISFECDYNNGAHPKVLQRLSETNLRQSATYGFDEWSVRAKEKIKAACEDQEAEVFFLVGGTQTNSTVIDGMLGHHQAVITVDTGHINVHEAGAIEFAGHKVIALPSHEGKLSVIDLQEYMYQFIHDESRDHMAQPGMIYISFPTELGTIYSAEELTLLYDACRKYQLLLFIDGARLGYGIASPRCDITLPWLARHCDAFYIGGTKVGALCGEAVVFTHENSPKQFFSIIKQHGALLAKGRLTGLQFDALFTDNLYFEISEHANNMAEMMVKLFKNKHFDFYVDSPTNQQFVILENDYIKKLEQSVQFTHEMPIDNEHSLCRFVTSWSTTEEDLKILESLL